MDCICVQLFLLNYYDIGLLKNFTVIDITKAFSVIEIVIMGAFLTFRMRSIQSAKEQINTTNELEIEENVEEDNQSVIDSTHSNHTEELEKEIFCVDDMAEKFKVSTKTLTRKTKENFDQTPNQLIIETRLVKAKEIMEREPQLPLKQVTEMVGLKNSSYLKKKMKERFNE
ncbi:MAG: helix-turn-helix domain-containing protein [Cytophagales bacterium]|nr:helix-turn-helix domain-containing protein [Cytophagales bacterium]